MTAEGYTCEKIGRDNCFPFTLPEYVLAESLRTGQLIDLRTHLSEGEGEYPNIRASFLRALVCGEIIPLGDADPHGLRVMGARIDERIDLDGTSSSVPLEFIDCTIPEGITAARANFQMLNLQEVRLGRDDLPRAALELSFSKIRDYFTMWDCCCASAGEEGTINIRLARVGGEIRCSASVSNTANGPAFCADNAQISQELHLLGSFEARCRVGVVRMLDAHIGGMLWWDASLINKADGPGICSDRAVIDGGVDFKGELDVRSKDASIQLAGAHIGGQFRCGAELINRGGGRVLFADGLFNGGGMVLEGTLRVLRGESSVPPATSEDAESVVSLVGSSIGGDFTCDGVLSNEFGGSALVADRMTVGGNVSLRGEFSSKSKEGTVSLPAASVGGQLQCLADITNGGRGPAFILDGARVSGELYIIGSYSSIDSTVTLSLLGVHVASELIWDPRSHEPERWLRLDGLTYRGSPTSWTSNLIDPSEWIDVLSSQTVAYAAQSWQQLASVAFDGT